MTTTFPIMANAVAAPGVMFGATDISDGSTWRDANGTAV